MATIQVTGNRFLDGVVNVGGAKNAAIPLICASLLAKGRVILRNVPRIKDIFVLISILEKLDCKIIFKGHTLLINNANLKYKPLLFEECKQMRGSYYLIGVFLTIFSKCEMSLPGGCNIGKRPIDLHLKAFEDLGFGWEIKDDILYINRIRHLDEGKIIFDKKSVGASLNAVFAGLGLNKLIIENCLFEPEGLDVIRFLNKMGYNITFNNLLEYNKTKIENKLIRHTVIFDRIEAMTYAVLGLLTGRLKIKNIETKYLKEPLDVLEKSGYIIDYSDKEINVYKSRGKGFEINTSEYPGFPTDLQSIYGVLSAFSFGKSIIKENIFENRMQLYYDLQKIGLKVQIDDNKATVIGIDRINSSILKACDLRHGAAMLLLALKMDGTSHIENYEYIERGYEEFIERINKLGGFIVKK